MAVRPPGTRRRPIVLTGQGRDLPLGEAHATVQRAVLEGMGMGSLVDFDARRLTLVGCTR